MNRYKTFKFFLFLILFFGIERFCYLQTGGFRISKVAKSPLTQEQSPPIPLPIRNQLNQSFHFLDSGVQSFAFLGADQNSVLKLFKYHPSKKEKMATLSESLKIAALDLYQETGMIYHHVGKSNNDHFVITIYDKIGVKHTIDLAKTTFVLQKKAEPFCHRLDWQLRGEKREDALICMKSLLRLIDTRSKKGIKNRDCRVLRNCGFIKEMPIEIDIGSYRYRSASTHPNPHKQQVEKSINQLLGWVHDNYPKDEEFFKTHLKYEKHS